MAAHTYPHHATRNGYMTEQIRARYIIYAVAKKLLPENAHRMANIISLSASNDATQPIQLWQLYSVLGQDRIVDIVRRFYTRVFNDEGWFTSVFAAVGGIEHHVNTQASMWIDVMGGGPLYHGSEYRLSFHHTHNAMKLMNEKGAARWVKLMKETLDDSSLDLTEDSRVRPSINTFLSFFVAKYADEFGFHSDADFGTINPAPIRRINFSKMTDDAIEALSVVELKEALITRGVDITGYVGKGELVNRAKRF